MENKQPETQPAQESQTPVVAPVTSSEKVVEAEATTTLNPTEVRQPKSGQSRRPRGLTFEQLNSNEQAVLTFLKGHAGEATITDITANCFSAVSTEKGKSWTRNALRRLVSEGHVIKPSRGKYTA